MNEKVFRLVSQDRILVTPPNLLIASPLAMQIETKIELARVKVILQFFKDLNKLTSNSYLSSHFPSFIIIQTGDSCNCDGEL